MKYRVEPNGYLLRLFVDEELEPALFEFARMRSIQAAHFWGIGAAKGIVLGSYDLGKKTYRKANLDGIWEIASLAGTLARTSDGPILHVHGVFSDEACQARAGHVFSLTCAATVELYLAALAPGLTRTYDDATGLKLLDL